jgi:hypothetical protein
MSRPLHPNSGLLRGTDPEKALRLAEGSQNMPRARGLLARAVPQTVWLTGRRDCAALGQEL